jgi:hypothetical protein
MPWIPRPSPARRVRDLGGSDVTEVREDGDSWLVMRDPEGNEFCLLPQVAGEATS